MTHIFLDREYQGGGCGNPSLHLTGSTSRLAGERLGQGPEHLMSAASKASPEIWLEIGHYIDSFRELAALARVNRALYGIFQVNLYCKAVGQSCTAITVLAAAKGNLDTLKVAAAFGADLNRVYTIPPPVWNRDGSREPIMIPLEQCWATPLHLAVQNGHGEVVRWLVHVHKVKINSPGRFLCPCMPAFIRLSNSLGGPRISMPARSHPVWTPLHLAICQNHASIARELLENGGSHDTLIAHEDLAQFENGAWKVLSVPDRPQRQRIPAQDYWKSVAGVKLTHIAASSGSKAIMALVVRDFGGDVNAADGSAATPLHYAILEKDELMIRHLLSLGADPDRHHNHVQHGVLTNSIPWGALDFALRYEPRLASILLEHGASVWNPTPRRGPIESSLKNIICYHDANTVPPDLRLLLRLTREQERRRSLSTWAAFEFRLAEEEIQATFFRACQSPAFDIQDLEAFIDDGELELGSMPMHEALHLQLSLPPHKCKKVTAASKDWELVNFDTSKNSLASLALCLAVRVIRPRHHAYTTVRWLLDKGAHATIELQEGVETSVIAILLKQIDTGWVAHLSDLPINWEENPLRDIARTISLLRDRGAWSLERDKHTNMAGAMALPAETWLQIAHFSERRDLAALARTNRRLHSLINRELYRTTMEEDMYPLTLGAVKAGNLGTLKVAAAYGADLDMPFPQPFCDQVLGIWDRAHDIDRGPEMAEEDKEHDWAWAAPLHVAVMQGRYGIVEWLIEQGVNLENPGRHICGCLPIIHRPVPQLEEEDPKLYQFPAWTPLHYAICHKQTSVARLLLAAGACSTELVVSPASAKSLSWDMRYLTETNSMRTYLLSSSRDDDSYYVHAISALHIAASVGNHALLSDLIDNHGLNVNIEDGSRSTPLLYAITASDATTANYLMSLGADPDHQCDFVGDAFDWARVFEQPYLAMQLLAAKGSPWFEDSERIKRPRLKTITSVLNSSLELEQNNSPSLSEIFQKTIPTIIRRTRETHIPGPGFPDLEMELAISFLHASPSASLSDADLQFLLETSGISLDMEVIPKMDAEDLHLLHGLSYEFIITDGHVRDALG
ncbi:hypothetical protein CcaCcLH18_06936 [Colletotrichum camelliae]|nr:hypothetical protein CcaCcLH18_06936 [Colletotrichum camelliae]